MRCPRRFWRRLPLAPSALRLAAPLAALALLKLCDASSAAGSPAGEGGSVPRAAGPARAWSGPGGRRTQAIDLGINVAYRTEMYAAQAQVARDTAAQLSAMGDDVSPAMLQRMLEDNMMMHPEIYGAAIAIEPNSYPLRGGVLDPRLPGLLEGVPLGSAVTTLQPMELWPGYEAVLYCPYGHRREPSRPGFVYMDLSNGYNYFHPGTEWYHAPRAEFLNGSLLLREGYWTAPYFDEAAGNIAMVTFSVPFWRRTPVPNNLPDDEYVAHGMSAPFPVNGNNGQPVYFWGIATVDLALGDLTFNCSATEVWNAELRSCSGCPAGQYREVVSMGPAVCNSCRRGTFAGSPGATACALCVQGQYQPEAGQNECRKCQAVLAGSTTGLLGSFDQDDCVCPAASYRPDGGGACDSCPVAMTCAIGSDMANLVNRSGAYPQVAPGFMSLETAPLQIYKCSGMRGEMQAECPGGAPASCGERRDSTKVACAGCVEGAFMEEGKCAPCPEDSTNILFVVLTVLAALIGLAVTTIVVNRNLVMQPNTMMMSVALTGLLFTGIQTMGVFSALDISWFEPVATILRAVSLLTFDLQILKPVCVASLSVVGMFFVRQLIAPMCVPYVLAILCGKKVFKRETNICHELCNTVGTCFSLFFISIVVSCFAPLVCYRHPDYSASAPSSMVSSPSILCFDGEDHTAITLIGTLVLCLVPLPFLAVCTLFTAKYPSYLQTGHEHLAMMRFLFFRFKAERYFYGVVVLLRGLSICLVPVVFRGDQNFQYWMMAALLSAFGFAQTELKPWRSELANTLDTFLTVSLYLLLFAGVLASAREESTETSDMHWLKVGGTVALIALMVAMGLGIGYGIYKRLMPHPFYNYFVCHHKAHAAAQARYLKMLIVRMRNVSAFIDSDDLTRLDSLFDVVKTKVGTLVAYLTRDTLSRPWCAGELVTAFVRGVEVISVETPAFRFPTSEELADLGNFLDLASCCLPEYGISVTMVAEAYEKLRYVDAVRLSANIMGAKSMLVVCKRVVSGISANEEPSPPLPFTAQKGCVLLSANPDSPENSCAAAILEDKMRARLLQFCEVGSVITSEHEQDCEAIAAAVGQARAVVAVLGAGSTECLAQVVAMVAASVSMGTASQGGGAVVLVNCPDFVFPGAAYYDSVLPRLWPWDVDEATGALTRFFNNISVAFPIALSDTILDAQAGEVLARLPKSHTPSSNAAADADAVVEAGSFSL